MSDHLSKLDLVRVHADLNFETSLSPKLKNSFLDNGKVVLSITVTNAFMKRIHTAYEQSDLTYIDIFNTQIECFQLCYSDRLEERFHNIANIVNKSLKTKYRSGKKRYTFLNEETSFAIYNHELNNVKEQNCTLECFKTENFELEQRCSSLLKDIEKLQNENFERSIECANLFISENSLKKKFDQILKTNQDYNSSNEKLNNTVSDHLETINHVKQDNSELQKSNQQLQQYIKKLEQTLPHPRKVNECVSEANRARQLRTLATKAEKALWFSESFGLTPKAILFSSSHGNDIDVRLQKTDYKLLDVEEKQKLRQLIYILDKFSISDAAYHELSMIDKCLPKKYLIVQERSNLNNIFHIERTPGEKPGAYVCIENEIASYIRTNRLENHRSVQVKLAGDGSKVSRISSFVTFTLSFPDSEQCVSVNSIRTVAVIKCNENHEDLSICASPIFKQFNSLLGKPEIKVDDKAYRLNLCFNGDMKFIQLCLGLSGATANYACPWCYVNKEQRKDISKEILFYENANMKRTFAQLVSNAEKKIMGSKHKPLVHIEPSNIVPDELHLFLRISDILLQNIIDDCRQLDGKAQINLESKRNADHIERFVKAVNDCGVNFYIWKDASGSPQFTSLTGGDYKKLFKSLPEKLVFIVHNATLNDTVYLIRELYAIQELINKKGESCPLNQVDVFGKVKMWMDTFLGLNKKGRIGYDRVTPYMHVLLYHVPTFYDMHGGIGRFSGQGVEKINDQIKQIHQKRSNKSDQTVDDLKTRKRIEYLIDQDCERNKAQYNKHNEKYWSTTIREKQNSKRRRINFEISSAHEQFEKENEIPIEVMSTEEVKQKLKKLGILTKVRKHDKLVQLLRNKMDK